MAVKLRLKRTGRKKIATYRLVATDSRSPRDGRFIEELGHYNPNSKPAAVSFNEENIYKWLKNGAQPSDTVRSILQREGIWEKWGLLKRGEDVSGKEPVKRAEKEKKPDKNRKQIEREKVQAEEAAKKAEEAKAAEEQKQEEAPAEEKTAE
ncbi:MAG: 30S ribosomal protein S16 [Fibrobacterota bacterium]